jgi:hypothetical protein
MTGGDQNVQLPYNPELNRIAEGLTQIINTISCSITMNTFLCPWLWPEAGNMARYLKNRVLFKYLLSSDIPFKLFYRKDQQKRRSINIEQSNKNLSKRQSVLPEVNRIHTRVSLYLFHIPLLLKVIELLRLRMKIFL